MSDERETDDLMPRPGWRYVLWFGWNLLALAWIGVGIVVGALTNAVCSPVLQNGQQLQGAVSIAVGVAVVVADIICRSRDSECHGWRGFVSPFAGGALAFIPAWLIALGIIATGIATVLGKA